jgi:phosphoglycolate phosphatase-like HAD superfamily hydrolase
MEEKLKGYTEEEFQSLLALMGLDSLFKITRGGNVWGGDTPEERFLIIEVYRKAVADREEVVTNARY